MSSKTRSQERLEKVGLYLAQRRTARGRAWLMKNAPGGWYRNFFHVRGDGGATFRAHDSYDNQCALALAFEHEAKMANTDGYVTFGSVAQYFKLSPSVCEQLGFAAQGPVTAEILDAQWKKVATSFSMGPRRHDGIPVRAQAA